MKRILLLIALLLAALPFYGQGVRYDWSPLTTTTQAAGVTNIITPITNGVIHWCNAPANAVPCTNFATTYTDVTLSSSCSTSTPVVLAGTSTCVAAADALGNGGVWAPAGQYAYTVTSGSTNYGPFPVTLAVPQNSPQLGPNPWIDITHPTYGGKNDGVCTTTCSGSDNTPALNAAIAAACAAHDAGIFFPPGTYVFASKPNNAGCGLWIIGSGNGSNFAGGTALIANYNEVTPTNGFLTWDGSFGTCCNGTGGGLRNLTIYKGGGFSGGTPIVFTGANDNHRAGWESIEDVVTSSVGSATWNKGLIVDGSCCTTSGGQGVRDISIRHFWPANATDTDTCILFKNAVQVFWYGGEAIQAAGGSCGITITGAGLGVQASTNIFISQVYFTGNVNIDFADSVYMAGIKTTNLVTTSNTSFNCHIFGGIFGTITNTNCSILNTGPGVPASDWIGRFRIRGGIYVGNTGSTNQGVGISGTPMAGASQTQYFGGGTYGSDATGTGASFQSQPATTAAAYTMTNAIHFWATNIGLGAGSSVTNQYGYYCPSMTSATNNYCLFMPAAAKNFLGGPLQIADAGTCTMAAGTCAAQNLSMTYAIAPRCYATFTGTGALAGVLKVASTTTTATPSSTNGADTAVVNWFCLGN